MAEKKSIFTLNLGSQRVGLARFGIGSKGSLMLRGYEFADLPGDSSMDAARKSLLTSAIKELAGRMKSAETETNYAVPAQNTIIKFVKLPALGEAQVDKIVGFEAQQAVPFPLAETVWDYQVMGKVGGENEVAIVAVRADQLEDLNSAVLGGGLKPHLVDAAPVALYNAFRYNYGDAPGCSLLLDLGARATNCIFIEGDRAFVSSFLTGGALITQNIAKELEIDFATAEAKKTETGFVHLGGNYADHEDPEVDAISKVIRNSMTRIHNEIKRRIQQYSTQQGGSAPAAVYLAGGGAALPYMKEFLEEKLHVSAEYFNSLRNVSVGPKVDVERASREAHMLGELVGLALREMSCPIELDLAPRSVEVQRAVATRKPMLIAAAGCLFAALGTAAVFENTAAGAKEKKLSEIQKDVASLQGQQDLIAKEEKREQLHGERVQFIDQVLKQRAKWSNLFSVINAQLSATEGEAAEAAVGDKIWVVKIEALDKNRVVIPAKYDLSPPVAHQFDPGAPEKPSPEEVGKARIVAAEYLHVVGLCNGGKPLVNSFFDKLRKLTDYFSVDEEVYQSEESRYLTSEANPNKIANRFTLLLPLKDKLEMKLPPADASAGN